MGNNPSCNQNAIPAPAPSETLFLVDQHPNLDETKCGAFSVPLNVGDLNGATMGKLQVSACDIDFSETWPIALNGNALGSLARGGNQMWTLTIFDLDDFMRENAANSISTTGAGFRRCVEIDWIALEVIPGDTPCEGSCMGDPHFLTWGNEWYDFHGECDLAWLNNPDFADGTGMWVHIRTQARAEFSYIESAAIKIGDDVLEVGAYGEWMVNGISHGEDLTLDRFPVKHTKSEKHHAFEVELDDGKKVSIHSFKDLVSVKISGGTLGETFKDFGNSTGMMGEIGTGNLLARNSSFIFADPNAFGNEWQVLDTEPKLFQTNRYPQYPVKCTMPAPKDISSRRLGESIAESTAEKACAHWGDQKDQCVFDVLAMNDIEVASHPMAGAF